MSKYWYRTRKFIALKVLHADDTPHAVALGAAIATLIAFLPLVGFQTVIAIGIAAIFRANKAICIPIVWVTNPFTMGPIYYGCFALGRFVLPGKSVAQQESISNLIELAKTGSIFDIPFWTELFHIMMTVGTELWLGCTLIGVVLGIVSYFIARSGVITYRERRRQRMLKKSLLQSKIQPDKVVRHSEPL